MRIGTGFDVHRLAAGRRLVLGGVEIPSPQGLEGHSDADVILHAVMDAVLGALAKGDIGQHFPNTDVRYKDADSLQLASLVAQIMKDEAHEVGNIDVMVLAEAPKLAPYVASMRERIAFAFGCTVTHVSVKATTMETLGFVGRGEGIAAQAVVLLNKVEEGLK